VQSNSRHDLAVAKYRTGSIPKCRLQYHIGWMSKYRWCILQGEIAVRLKKLLYESCGMNKWWISELTIQEDHEHLIQMDLGNRVADVIQRLKGRTSRVIRKEFLDFEGVFGEIVCRWMDILPKQ
jgi:putative transposase